MNRNLYANFWILTSLLKAIYAFMRRVLLSLSCFFFCIKREIKGFKWLVFLNIISTLCVCGNYSLNGKLKGNPFGFVEHLGVIVSTAADNQICHTVSF